MRVIYSYDKDLVDKSGNKCTFENLLFVGKGAGIPLGMSCY